MSDYHKLPIAAKRAQAIASVREPPMVCRACGTSVMADDLLAHRAQRCPGLRNPGPSAKWLTWREAVQLGVARETLYRWAAKGRIRFRIRHGGVREFLKGDLVAKLEQRLAIVVDVPISGNETDQEG